MPREIKTCLNCKKEFIVRSKRHIFCSVTCSQIFYDKKYIQKTKLSNILPTATIGALAELMVCADLMRCGYEVFRAMSPASDCDVLAIKNDEIYKFEVRTGQYYAQREGDPAKIKYPFKRTKGKRVVVVTHCDNKIHYIDPTISAGNER